MATLNDVAAAAGVSVSAVSRVLADSPTARVSDATRGRIKAAAKELGYRPNFAARALKSSVTRVVGLVIPDLTNALFTEVVGGVESTAEAKGYMTLLARAEGIGASESKVSRLIGEGRVDGVILQVDESMSQDEFQRLVDANLPLIFVNSAHRGHAGSVCFDDAAAAELATRHLLDLGHRRIGLVGGLRTTETARRRHEGYVRALGRAGVGPSDELATWTGYQPGQGAEGLRQLMALPEPPSAVVVSNINAALGALAAARQLEIHVPEDLSIISLHDSWTAETTWPPLTTVRLPWAELGAAAVEQLMSRIETGSAEDVVITSPAPRLMLRSSTLGPR